MAFKKIGEKIKHSLHHLSPKSKRAEAAEEHAGDLSPLPQLAVEVQQAPPSVPASAPPQSAIKSPDAAKSEENKKSPAQPLYPLPHPEPDATPYEPPACLTHGQPAPVSEPNTTPRWQKDANIWPTMHYLVKTSGETEVQQSVLLVNPSKNEKDFALHQSSGCAATLSAENISIQGGSAERMTVSFKPDGRETHDVCIDLMNGGFIYDRIRVQTSL